MSRVSLFRGQRFKNKSEENRDPATVLFVTHKHVDIYCMHAVTGGWDKLRE